jgi:hypothetical protein
MDGVNVLADGVAHAEHRDVVVVVPAAMDEQAGGLVGDDDVLVDEEELDAAHDGALPVPSPAAA